jgi:hypothetical protein
MEDAVIDGKSWKTINNFGSVSEGAWQWVPHALMP